MQRQRSDQIHGRGSFSVQYYLLPRFGMIKQFGTLTTVRSFGTYPSKTCELPKKAKMFECMRCILMLIIDHSFLIFVPFTLHRNELERKFLELLQFNINVPSSVYAKYYFDLRTLADKNGLSLPFQQLNRGRAVKLEVCFYFHPSFSIFLCFCVNFHVFLAQAVSKLTDYELIEFWRTGQRKWSSMESLKITSKERFIPRPLVICGPSGSGKSTLLRRLMSEFSQYLGFSISRECRVSLVFFLISTCQ